MVRQALGLTASDLAELSGISLGTIYRIERRDTEYKVNKSTAEALADAMYVQILDIFDAQDLSHLGRPPHTGRPCNRATASTRVVCPHCRYEVRLAQYCAECEKPLTALG